MHTKFYGEEFFIRGEPDNTGEKEGEPKRDTKKMNREGVKLMP